MNAMLIRALSAMGSAIFPKLVMSPRLRARSPSTRSVAVAMTNTPAAHHRMVALWPLPASSSQP